eukprot:scaffold99551_cov31-Tisochrysis_lutea.AAC.1
MAIELGGPPHSLHGNCSMAHAALCQWSEALASAELMLHFCGAATPRAAKAFGHPMHGLPDGRAAPNARSLLGLPDDVITYICSQLGLEDLTRMLRTCRRIHRPIQAVLRSRMAETASARRAKAHYRRACALIGLHQWDAAIRACEAAIQLRRMSSPTLQQLLLLACAKCAKYPNESSGEAEIDEDGPDHTTARIKFDGGRVIDVDSLPLTDGQACLIFIAALAGQSRKLRPLRAVVKGKLLTATNAIKHLRRAAGAHADRPSRIVIQILGDAAPSGDGSSGAHPDDIDCLVKQTGVERDKAVAALVECGGDLLQAIAELGLNAKTV